MLFIVNKNSIAKQNKTPLETDIVEFFMSLVSVAGRFLREENQDNAHESNANVNVNKGSLSQLYLSISYNSRAGSTSKSKVPGSKHSLRSSHIWFKTNREALLLIKKI